MTPVEACACVHAMVATLPVRRFPADDALPANGLYFVYESSETESHTKTPRIVRIGSHATPGQLGRRLRQHSAGGKNGSVFRKALGGALLRRENAESPCLGPQPGQGHWEKQDMPTCPLCAPLEVRVSALLAERFRFRCVRIDDAEERARFERCLIATLAACPLCRQSPEWLGVYAYNAKIRASGLWLSNYLRASPVSTLELARFEVLVRCTT